MNEKDEKQECDRENEQEFNDWNHGVYMMCGEILLGVWVDYNLDNNLFGVESVKLIICVSL